MRMAVAILFGKIAPLDVEMATFMVEAVDDDQASGQAFRIGRRLVKQPDNCYTKILAVRTSSEVLDPDGPLAVKVES